MKIMVHASETGERMMAEGCGAVYIFCSYVYTLGHVNSLNQLNAGGGPSITIDRFRLAKDKTGSDQFLKGPNAVLTYQSQDQRHGEFR